MSAVKELKSRLYYGWVVMASLSLVGTILWGTRFSFGVFFKSIESEFGLTRAATSSIFSVYMVLGGVFTILGGWALDKYGPKIVVFVIGLFTALSLVLTSQTDSLWQLFITYSLLLAVGTSPTYLVVMSSISKWFEKKRGMALGIANIGAGLGTVIFAPVATLLIANYDWRFAYLIMGLVAALVVLPLSQLLKRGPEEIGALPDGVLSKPGIKKEQSQQDAYLTLSQAARTKSFWFFVFMFTLSAFSQIMIITHLVPHITDIGFSAVTAAAILSLASGASVLGRIIMGALSDKMGRKMTSIFCSTLQGLTIIWLSSITALWMFYPFAILFGIAYGGRGVVNAGLIGDTFGLRRMGSILGVVEAGFFTGAAIGPAIGGYIFDIRGSYSLAFILAGVAVLIVALLTALIRCEKDRYPCVQQGQPLPKVAH